jgi:hypothetical protein
VSDGGEFSQFAGIGTQTTLDRRTAYAFHCAGRHNTGPSSPLGLSYFRGQ